MSHTHLPPAHIESLTGAPYCGTQGTGHFLLIHSTNQMTAINNEIIYKIRCLSNCWKKKKQCIDIFQ